MDALYRLSYRGNFAALADSERPEGQTRCFGAGSRTRTYEGRSREIYSLLSLPLDDSSNTFIISKKVTYDNK